MKTFNTSGPNNPQVHYTLQRIALIRQGVELVQAEKYFTIWAPRQTGKSTYFRQLAQQLAEEGYRVAHINFENYATEPLHAFLARLVRNLLQFWDIDFAHKTMGEIFEQIETLHAPRLVLIIDEVEGINPEYFGAFLHAIRSVYHSRESHALKSVILVGVSNIVGVVSDNASPFNIADNLEVPYFSSAEVDELLAQHERATGQRFAPEVKTKIQDITANQPGLVNGFAQQLVARYPDAPVLGYEHYLQVEDWYLTEAIDKNFANILNKAREHRPFVERLLYTDDKIPFAIDRESIKVLHTNGLIRKDSEGNVAFWVPFYAKRLFTAFYPYTNGEQRNIRQTIYAPDYFGPDGAPLLQKLVASYKEYIRRRGFQPHRERDANGQYTSLKEAALIYSFETFIHAIINELDGKIYREANTGLGKSDMIVNLAKREFVIETKVYSGPQRFQSGKKQLAYYCRSLGLQQGIYLVFCPSHIHYPAPVREQVEHIDGIEISSYLVEYDEQKWD